MSLPGRPSVVTRIRRWLHRAQEAIALEPSTERAADDAIKADLQRRVHDQRAALHVLEWQADVRGRRAGKQKQ